MCGILVSLRCVDKPYVGELDSPDSFKTLSQRLQEANTARGPDAQGTYRSVINFTDLGDFGDGSTETSSSESHQNFILDFFASELRLRGNAPIVQPHEKDGDVLCWNGEIFDGMNITAEENDGVKLFGLLRSLGTPEQVRDFFGTLEGPYAFVYYNANSRRLFFARDPLGRRSLLIHKPTADFPYLLLSSVSAGVDARYSLEEVSTNYIYYLDLESPWNQKHVARKFWASLVSLPRLPSSMGICAFASYAEPSKVNTLLPPDGSPQIPSLDDVPDYLALAVDDLIYHLDKSVFLRVKDIPRSPGIMEGEARVAVLFSGGIDSTILTYFAHKHIPPDEPIDLLNVAFENPRKMKVHAEGNFGGVSKKQKKLRLRTLDHSEKPIVASYMVPDRITGLQELQELRRLCPGRTWNFIEINVPYEESQACRSIVEALMLPGRTVMDLSLALALYFASRGIGQVRASPDSEPTPYTSRARVLLNGLGSDELLGGYGRHRTAFNAGGWPAVINELQLEIENIPTRNLGRDDRVISSHGKETRHPFLSLTVVAFLAELPVHFKMDPRLDLGFGDKMLLRMAARKVGLKEASERKKRAMQFGSHSARMEGERRGDVRIDAELIT